MINSVELPDNLGTPTQLIILRGGLYSVVCSNTGLVCIVNLLQNDVESLQQLHTKKIVKAQILNDLLVTFSEDGYVKYHSFGM